MGELVQTQSLITLSNHVQATRNSLIISEDITQDEWNGLTKSIIEIRGASHWWIGDCLNFGERRWGEMYSRALDDTAYEYQTLANDKWVAGTFQFSRRRENLSWSHHAAVASIKDVTIQDAILDQAEVERWTRDELRKRLDPNHHVSDDSYEWYTPADYIEAARDLMGGIDLDPASSKEAQRIVLAGTYYTKGDDGLSKDWFGRVWLNPPYSMPDVEQFIDRVVENYNAGAIDCAVVLTNNGTDTGWFHKILSASGIACFTKGRVKFWGPNSSQARQGQTIFYLGESPEKFAEKFRKFGLVVTVV